ncbi:MAG: class I SAM-dependent methyltransferase, partial [Acidobacteriota bacterium]
RFRRLTQPSLAAARPIRCLDYGSGTGFVPLAIGQLLKSDDMLICVDLSEQLLEVCRENLSEAGFPCRRSFLPSNGKQIPVEDDSIDILTANSVLHHIYDLETFGLECHRVIKEGGLLIASHEPNGDRNAPFGLKSCSFVFQLLLNPSLVVHKLVETSPALERALRKILSKTSASYRHRNQMLRDIARQLRQEGLVDRDLRGVEIQQLVDYHTERGLRKNHLLQTVFTGFDLIEWQTYSHLGEQTLQSSLTRRLGRAMERVWPEHGHQIEFVLRKTDSGL